MPNLLIRDVPDYVVQTLKRRARHHRRSLQHELLTILEHEAQATSEQTPAEIAHAIRDRLAAKGIRFDDSTPLIRQDRER